MILSYVFFFWRVLEKSGDVEDVIVGWLVSWNMQFFEIVSVCMVWVWIVGDLKLKLLN